MSRLTSKLGDSMVSETIYTEVEIPHFVRGKVR
jgi:hypothetical protein